MSLTPNDVRASTHEDSTRPLPEAEIQRMRQVLNRHRSGSIPRVTDGPVAGTSPAAGPQTTITVP